MLLAIKERLFSPGAISDALQRRHRLKRDVFNGAHTGHGDKEQAGARSIAFCSASATTGPTSRSASRRTTRVSSLRISTASAVEKDKSRSILALFSESAESPSVAKSNGHFSVPRNRRARTAATTCIAAALPRRVPSCADTLPRFFGFGRHFAASLCRAHGANPPWRRRDSRNPCLCHKPRG